MVLAAARLAGARAGAGSGSGEGPWGPVGGILSSVLGHSTGGRTAGGPTETGRVGFATGAAECCICPVCRGIAALRDPSPEFAERLATGAGDLAAGVASLLRAFASAGDPAHRPPEPGEAAPPPPRTGSTRGRAIMCGARPPVPGMILSRRRSRTCGPPRPGGGSGRSGCRRAARRRRRAGRAAGFPTAGRPTRGVRVADTRRRGRGRTRRRGLTTGHPGPPHGGSP